MRRNRGFMRIGLYLIIIGALIIFLPMAGVNLRFLGNINKTRQLIIGGVIILAGLAGIIFNFVIKNNNLDNEDNSSENEEEDKDKEYYNPDGKGLKIPIEGSDLFECSYCGFEGLKEKDDICPVCLRKLEK